jgi:antitoxin component YwqK of YwqJK toxin-antitoxin module
MSDEYIWFKNGKEFRRTADEEGDITTQENLPNGIVMEHVTNGNASIKTYKKNGVLHRDGDEPARIVYRDAYDVDTLKKVEYHKSGMRHRDGDKPQSITYDKYGDVEIEQYLVNDQMHRDGDKPAYIYYYDNGDIRTEVYIKNDDYHRDGNKPAIIRYDKEGNIESMSYYIHGEEQANQSDKDLLDELGVEH